MKNVRQEQEKGGKNRAATLHLRANVSPPVKGSAARFPVASGFIPDGFALAFFFFAASKFGVFLSFGYGNEARFGHVVRHSF